MLHWTRFIIIKGIHWIRLKKNRNTFISSLKKVKNETKQNNVSWK